MSNELALAAFAILLVALMAHMYNWGWERGHAVHHDDDEHGPPAGPPGLYR